MKHLKKSYSRGVAKFVRIEKARIRRLSQDPAELARQISALRERFTVHEK